MTLGKAVRDVTAAGSPVAPWVPARPRWRAFVRDDETGWESRGGRRALFSVVIPDRAAEGGTDPELTRRFERRAYSALTET